MVKQIIDKAPQRISRFTDNRYVQGFMQYLVIVVGAGLAALGLEGFLIPNGFLDGGVVGVSIITSNFVDLPVGAFIAVLNVPFIWITWRKLGGAHAVKTTVGVGALALGTVWLHHMKPLTENYIHALGFGGLLVGLGVGMALRQGGALDGTESLAHIISAGSRYDVDQIILWMNVVIFAVAAAVMEPEKAMGSAILFYVVIAPVIKRVVDGGAEMEQARVVTRSPQAVAEYIAEHHHRKVSIGRRTVYPSGGGEPYISHAVTFLVSRVEKHDLWEEIKRLDPIAMMTYVEVTSQHGGIYESDDSH
ncbi:MAG: YitT family protein [Gordonia sp. (in: high G+C Gram-positive bacteria)]|uniref:YitT family protein n=1 Tax=Gordonia sp. (in: high G+C Gram-positive bacteria) TaxID=84139 RepID=UPI0039E3B6CB